MYIIGVDYSLNFPSICISRDFLSFEFLSIVNTKNISNVHKEFLLKTEARLPSFDVGFLDGVTKSAQYHVNERSKLLNYIEMTNSLVRLIRLRIGALDVNDVPILGIEGYSYGSKGSSVFEIPAASSLFKRDVFEKVLGSRVDNYFVFSPSTLKQALGLKGNAKKTEIFERFLEEPGIDAMRGNGFYAFLLENRDNPRVFNPKSGKVESPFNDLLDAYLSVLTIYNNVKK